MIIEWVNHLLIFSYHINWLPEKCLSFKNLLSTPNNLYITMKGKILLLAVCLAIASKSQEIVCTLNSSSPFDCNSPSNICPNATTTIIAAPDTNYQCPQPLILSAYSFNISGSYSALEIKGSQIYVMNVIVFSDFNISSKSRLS